MGVELRNEDAPSPGFFVSADSKGVTERVSVSAESKGVAGGFVRPKPGETRCSSVSADSTGLSGEWRVTSGELEKKHALGYTPGVLLQECGGGRKERGCASLWCKRACTKSKRVQRMVGLAGLGGEGHDEG